MIYNRPEYWLGGKKMPKPDGDAYLIFVSPSAFSVGAGKGWDGVIEYFTIDGIWDEWDGSSIEAKKNDDGYVLYLRGTNNTKVTGSRTDSNKWSISGADVRCHGNIELLLDYATVEANQHPTMDAYCYCSMFKGCTGLTEAPSLPATTLTQSCYYQMFYGCNGLKTAPSLPATTVPQAAYAHMFRGCDSLKKAPSLPATTLGIHCYTNMFEFCTGLIEAPSLPATTLEDYCYDYMFRGCENLITVPSLPATKLEPYCYRRMFYGCSKIKLSSKNTGNYLTAYRIPASGTGTDASKSMDYMFGATGGTFTEDPSINTTYYLDSSNTVV